MLDLYRPTDELRLALAGRTRRIVAWRPGYQRSNRRL